MKFELAKEVMACLPKGRTLFHYSKDDYAFLLLHLMAQKEQRIQNIRRGHAARLLEKPALKPHLARCPDGRILPDSIPRHQYLPDGQAYRLTLGIWGDDLEFWRYNQVSRKGVSLVLQVNLNQSFTKKLSRCVDLGENDPFEVTWHPVRNGRHPTLAWCRLDFDLEKREALIEEVQSDLLRDVKAVVGAAARAAKRRRKTFRMYGSEFRTRAMLDLWRKDFSAHEKTWHEATLTAAISFLIEELGMKQIYYHTPESGKFLKEIRGTLPPASLYTSLPKKFCFQLTDQCPDLVKQDKRWKRRHRKMKRDKTSLRFFNLKL